MMYCSLIDCVIGRADIDIKIVLLIPIFKDEYELFKE